MIPNNVPLPDGTIVRVVDEPESSDGDLLGKVMAIVNIGGLMHMVEPVPMWDDYKLAWAKAKTYPMPRMKQLVGIRLWITSPEIVRAWCSIEEKP